jgi:hypothetical protein
VSKAHSAAAYARWFASQGGEAPVAAMTAKQRQELASLAGVARWRKSTKAERKAAAQRAAQARWAKYRVSKNAADSIAR